MRGAFIVSVMVCLNLSPPAQAGSAESTPSDTAGSGPCVRPLEGAPNLHRVAHNFYRSAQPDEQGFAALTKRCGLHTVINLRAFHSDEPLTRGLGLRLYD